MSKILGFACVIFSLAAMLSDALAQSHLNVPIGQHVVLRSSRVSSIQGVRKDCLSSNDLLFNLQVLPTNEVVEFAIPAGKTLVITDVNWQWQDQKNRFPNRHQILRVYLHHPEVNPRPARYVTLTGAQLDRISAGSKNISMLSGFTVVSGTAVCGTFQMDPPDGDIYRFAVIRGYLQ